MDHRPLERKRRYLLKHTSQTVPAFVSALEHRTNIATLSHEPAETLEMNGIGVVSIQLLRPIALDTYGENRSTGAFILIDPETNSTVAAGMVTATTVNTPDNVDDVIPKRVTAEERLARWGHRGGVLELSGSSEIVDTIERSLFTIGAITSRIETEDDLIKIHVDLLEALIQSQVQWGFIALVVTESEAPTLTARVEDRQLTLDASDPASVITAVHELLAQSGILHTSGKANAQ